VKFRHLAAAMAALFVAAAAQAEPFTFAQFKQKGTDDTIRVTNGAGSTGTLVDIADPTVTFSFLLPQLAAAGLESQDATFQLSGVITQKASVTVQTGPDPLNQLIDSGTLSFTRLVAAPEGTGLGARTNLLTISFTNALLTGFVGGTSGSVLASTPDSSLTFTSDFLTFKPDASLDFALALSSISGGGLARRGNNGAMLGVNESLRGFSADATGTFSSDPPPEYVVPEPAVVGLIGIGLAIIGWRRRRQALPF
jgi:hypothetical protein